MKTNKLTKETKPKTVAYEYKISPNYAVYSIAGGHGGSNLQGEIILNLFSERPTIPKKEICEIDQDAKTIKLQASKTEQKDGFIRDVLFGISLNVQKARAISHWLNNKANELEAIIKNSNTEIQNIEKNNE